jgi:hypothetical protein
MFGNKSKTVIKHSPILKNWGEHVKGKKWERLLERARWRNKEVTKKDIGIGKSEMGNLGAYQ